MLLDDLQLLLVDGLADLLVFEDIRDASIHVLVRAVLGRIPRPARVVVDGDGGVLLPWFSYAEARATALTLMLRGAHRDTRLVGITALMLRHDDVGEGSLVCYIDISSLHVVAVGLA